MKSLTDSLKEMFGLKKEEKFPELPANLSVLPVVPASGIVLKDGERCHYRGNAWTEKTTSRVTGYQSQRTGGNVRIAKGFSVNTGGTERQAIRETTTETNSGVLYVTSARIVFIAPKEAFDRPLSSLSAYMPQGDQLSLLFGNQSYTLCTNDAFRIRLILDGIFDGLPAEE